MKVESTGGALPRLPQRAADGHKGTYGSVLVIAGSRGMAGAAALSGIAALRSGAGLVRVATSAEVQPTVASFEPALMTLPLDADEVGLIRAEPAKKALTPLLEKVDVVAIGPGIGQSDDLRDLVRWILDSVQVPTILDADALNALAGQTQHLGELKRPVVITPHPGEFARLTGRSTAEIQADREAHAMALAQAEHLVVVLKGAKTIVTNGERVHVNSTGNPGMATGGSGDVLTGVIAALIGQKLPAFEAAQLGVYVHGLAGDMARDRLGEVGMIASDLLTSLPPAFERLGR